MGSLARPPTSTDQASSPALSEGAEADYVYFTEVLRLDGDKSEVELDRELIAKAAELGIDASRPATAETTLSTTPSSSPSRVTTPSASHTQRTPSSQSSIAAPRSISTSYSCPNLKSSLPNRIGGGGRPAPADPRRWSQTLSFSLYDKYLAQLGPNITQPKFVKAKTADSSDHPRRKRFGFTGKGGISGIANGFKTRIRWTRRATSGLQVATTSCVCCREDFDRSSAFQSLPCGHTYCCECLRTMIDQALMDESKMPPRCCTLPVPSPVLGRLLDAEEQLLFLKAVAQFSTPWELRVFCPNPACGEFIPPRGRIDPKRPFVVACRKCGTAACSMCKRSAHRTGQDCPDDIELDAVLRIGEKSGWRRCYRCRALVELTQGCTHVTCRCKAQFCYICGAVWDPSVGCPNFCNGEEELERRRAEEEAEVARLEAEKAAAAAERRESESRTAGSAEFAALRAAQAAERARFLAHSLRRRDAMRARQIERKRALAERHSDAEERMRERHAKTVAHLEDRQIAAEMELRETLAQSERSIRIRLKYMEAYCDGLGRGASGNTTPDTDWGMPARKVTERDLRELGQQYNLRDGMERLHNAKINVMRDRQLKAVEELVERQKVEWRRLLDKEEEEMEDLAAEFALEEDALAREFRQRKGRLQWRWGLAVEILRRELEERDGVKYVGIATPEWPSDLCSGETSGLGITAK